MTATTFSTKGLNVEEVATVVAEIVRSNSKNDYTTISKAGDYDNGIKFSIEEGKSGYGKLISGVYVETYITIMFDEKLEMGTIEIYTPILYWILQLVRFILFGRLPIAVLVPMFGIWQQYKFNKTILESFSSTVLQLSLNKK